MLSKPAVVPATLDDLDALVSLENELFTSDRIPRRQYRYLLTRANAISFKIEQHDRLVASLVLLRRKNSSKLRIYSLAVARQAQRLGFARLLVAHAEQLARDNRFKTLTLEVCEDNESAIRLYLAAGFHQHGTKPEYYQDGCTALLLKKDIPDNDFP